MQKPCCDTSLRQEGMQMMFHKVDATVLFVQDSGSATFQMENQYFLLLAPSTVTNLLSNEANPVKIEGSARFLLAPGVENVDATYETLKARRVTFLKPPISQPWGLRTAH